MIGGDSMTACHRLSRWFWLILLLPLAWLAFFASFGSAADSPVGKTITDIVPIKDRKSTRLNSSHRT